nr:uncharacterized protein LOC111509859 isoform X1 [Leptinotarsa decemlineata]
MLEKCRLCSSSTALISMTSGKRRQIRDYIRKLIEITTGIQFKKNDVLNLICFTCMLQIYNFYIFRTRSLENEKSLEVLIGTHEMAHKSSKTLLELCDIEIPDLEELKTEILPWIQSKLKDLECNEYKNSCNFRNDKAKPPRRHDMDQSSDISTQTTASTVVMIDEHIQVDPAVTWSVSTQISVQTVDKRTQCCLFTPTTDATAQTDSKLEDKETQHGHVLESKEKGIQCNDFVCITPSLKIESCSISDCSKTVIPISDNISNKKKENTTPKRVSFPINETNMPEKQHDTVCDSESEYGNGSVEGDHVETEKNISFLNALCLISIDSISEKQTNYVSPQRDTRLARRKKMNFSPNRTSQGGSGENADLAENDKPSTIFEDENDKIEIEKNALHVPSRQSDRSDVEKIENISLTLEAKSEPNTPQTPERENNFDEEACAKTGFQPQCLRFDSPRSSQLLAVTNKVQYVKICRECDHTMYSKHEAAVHKKSHMRCSLCKKKFTSIIKAKEHFRSKCDKKMTTMSPVVYLNKMEIPKASVKPPSIKESDDSDSDKKRRNRDKIKSPRKKLKT